MKTYRNALNQILKFLPFVFVFFASLYHPVDSDLGWHLKYGEYFFKHGSVLRENLFSAEMPNYLWPNSSWITDLISYSTFSSFGFFGLSVLGATVVTATFFLFSRAYKLSFFEECLIFPAVFFLTSPINSISFRGQLLSLLLAGLIFYILRLYEDNRSKVIYFLPFVFAIWSNVHGQFLLGLGLLALWTGTWSLKELFFGNVKKQEVISNFLKLLAILIVCALAVLINPFGMQVYTEALRHFGNPLQKYILEWLPFDQRSGNWMAQIVAGVVMFLGVIYLFFTDKLKDKVHQVSIALIFFVLTFWIRRYAWPMYYLSIPLMVPAVAFFKPETKKATILLGSVVMIGALVVVLIVSNPLGRISGMSWEKYCDLSMKCSNEAVEFLVKNDYKSDLLTVYDWGGWMIWNFPGIKPTIDGRMHLWRDETGYSAFENFHALEQNVDDISESNYEVVLMLKSKALYGRLENLAEKGHWQLVYEDESSGVFVRNSDN